MPQPTPHVEIDAALPVRVAATCGTIAFVACLITGGFGADNPVSVVLTQALAAMGVTFVVGYIVGMAAKKMVAESLSNEKNQLRRELEKVSDSMKEPPPQT
jgi:fructose-specific phosphotransferase system IIC component